MIGQVVTWSILREDELEPLHAAAKEIDERAASYPDVNCRVGSHRAAFGDADA